MKSYAAVAAIAGAFGIVGVYAVDAHDNGFHDDDDYSVEIDGFGDSDTDGDGRLSRQEFLDEQGNWGRRRDVDDANNTFDDIDANSDDYLEIEEVENYASEMAHQAMAALSEVWDDIEFNFSYSVDHGWDSDWDDDDYDYDDWDEDDDWDDDRNYRFSFELSDDERDELEDDMEELAEEMEQLGEELGMIGRTVGRSLGRAMRGMDRHQNRALVIGRGRHSGFTEEYRTDSNSFIIEREYSGDVDLDSDDIETRIAERKDEILTDMDANDDGIISRDEFRGRTRTFENMDLNGDDELSRDELRVRLLISRVIGIPRIYFARDN